MGIDEIQLGKDLGRLAGAVESIERRTGEIAGKVDALGLSMQTVQTTHAARLCLLENRPVCAAQKPASASILGGWTWGRFSARGIVGLVSVIVGIGAACLLVWAVLDNRTTTGNLLRILEQRDRRERPALTMSGAGAGATNNKPGAGQ